MDTKAKDFIWNYHPDLGVHRVIRDLARLTDEKDRLDLLLKFEEEKSFFFSETREVPQHLYNEAQHFQLSHYQETELRKSPYQLGHLLQKLIEKPCPSPIPSERWEKIINAAQLFTPKFTDELESFHWSLMDIFGCHPTNPETNARYNGFLLTATSSMNTDLINNFENIKEDRIVYATQKGYLLNFFKTYHPVKNQTTLLHLR